MTEKKEIKSIGEGLGISGFTLGVLSILFAGTAGAFISVIGGIFCFVQQRKNKTNLGKAGLILNILGLILSILYIAYLAPLLSQLIQTTQ
jgi:hypothetical protein